MQPSAPPGLDEAIRRCRAGVPEEQWPDARALAEELRRILEGLRTPNAVSDVARPADTRWLVAGLLAAALGLALALGLYVAERLR
jgi:hypothetical protein